MGDCYDSGFILAKMTLPALALDSGRMGGPIQRASLEDGFSQGLKAEGKWFGEARLAEVPPIGRQDSNGFCLHTLAVN